MDHPDPNETIIQTKTFEQTSLNLPPSAVDISHYDFDSDFEGPRTSVSNESFAIPENNEGSLYSDTCIVDMHEVHLHQNCGHCEVENCRKSEEPKLEFTESAYQKELQLFLNHSNDADSHVLPIKDESTLFHNNLSFWKKLDDEGTLHQTSYSVYPVLGASSGDHPRMKRGTQQAVPMIQITPPTEPPSNSQSAKAKPAFLDNLPPPPKKHKRKSKAKLSTTGINYDEYTPTPLTTKRPSASGSIRSGSSGLSTPSTNSLVDFHEGTKEPITHQSKGFRKIPLYCETCCKCSNPVCDKLKESCCKVYYILRESELFNCIVFTTIALLFLFVCLYLITYPLLRIIK